MSSEQESFKPASSSEFSLRAQIDRSVSGPVILFFVTSIVWLIFGTVFGILVSIKFHHPGFLDTVPELTFGRLRPVHLNSVIYGWASLALAGCYIWLTARLCKTKLQWGRLLYLSVFLWNLGVLIGIISLFRGVTTGQEWIEFTRLPATVIAVAVALFSLSIIRTFIARNVDHIYVSLWYILASVVWFPILYFLIYLPVYTGVTQAAANWWFAHNLLTVWVTPAGLAAAYYFIPKVIGRPIHSYYLSLLGFWTFALFYNWNGIHHLIGGPLPTWLISVSIIASMLMFIPVITVAINHHLTMVGHFSKLKYSPTLRFVVFGAICYTAVSFQGSLMAIRVHNEITHFTHYTVGHAHLGLYAFVTMILFGSVYYIMPRIVNWEWPCPWMIKLHFWFVSVGILLYFLTTTAGGFIQGLYMNDPSRSFMDSVEVTIPYLLVRTFSGILILIGHIFFIILFYLMLNRKGSGKLSIPFTGKRGTVQT